MNNNQENNNSPQFTVLDAQNVLLDYFLNHSTIKYDELGQFVTLKQDRDATVSTLLLGLQELVTKEVLKLNCLSDPANKATLIWSLNKSLFLRQQNLTIDGVTALRIGSILNSFSDNGDTDVDFLNITNENIQEILNIFSYLSQELSEYESEDETPQNPPENLNKKKKT